MGMKFSSCMVDSCGKENDSMAFSSVLSDTTELEQGWKDLGEAVTKTEIKLSKAGKDSKIEDVDKEVQIDIETLDSPRSDDSNQSVLSTISPTKEKSRNKK